MRRTTLLLTLIPALCATVGCGDIDEGPFVIDSEVDTVVVRLSSGDLTVRGHEHDAVLIDADFGGLTRPGTVGRYVEDGVLTIDYDCVMCAGDVTVGLPPHLRVEADVTQGDLTLVNLTGHVLGNVQAGALTGTDLACSANLSTRAGALDLAYSARPRQLIAQATFGAIDIALPSGAYDFDLGSRSGVIHLEGVDHDPDATSRIAAFAETGEITIAGWD